MENYLNRKGFLKKIGIGVAAVGAGVLATNKTAEASSHTVTGKFVGGVQNYRLVLSDAGLVIERAYTDPNTVIIPLHDSVPFPVGTVLEVCQVGGGQTRIVPESGVTIRNNGYLRVRWSSVTLRKRGRNDWVISGDTE